MTPDKAAVAAVRPDIVKPLEWDKDVETWVDRKDRDNPIERPAGTFWTAIARPLATTYQILFAQDERTENANTLYGLYIGHLVGEFDTLEAAQAAAQADYSARILSALDPAFLARIEALEEMRPHIDKIVNCIRINDEMGRVVTGQTDAARALKEIFDRTLGGPDAG